MGKRDSSCGRFTNSAKNTTGLMMKQHWMLSGVSSVIWRQLARRKKLKGCGNTTEDGIQLLSRGRLKKSRLRMESGQVEWLKEAVTTDLYLVITFREKEWL